MSALASTSASPSRRSVAGLHAYAHATGRPRLALLGTGTVGSAFVARYQRLYEDGKALPLLHLLVNARGQVRCERAAAESLRAAIMLPRHDGIRGPDLAALVPGDIIVDATASEAIAARHPQWLASGLHVVTANKRGNGGDLGCAQAIARLRRPAAQYGDSATVGAGLPLLRSIRALVAGGDRIHAVEGLLSGSMGWLFDRYDGMRPFSGFVREAMAAGYTEPDPRVDLGGEDVMRKLLILARAAGIGLQESDVQVDSLLPAILAGATPDAVDARLASLDAPLRRRYQRAWRDGARLRFVGGFERDQAGGWRASVGLRALPATHPLCAGSGTDNRVAIHSCRYRAQPLVIQGPGAGAEVTAAALLDDVLHIAGASPDRAYGGDAAALGTSSDAR
jgi:homoserine dehydrogenase